MSVADVYTDEVAKLHVTSHMYITWKDSGGFEAGGAHLYPLRYLRQQWRQWDHHNDTHGLQKHNTRTATFGPTSLFLTMTRQQPKRQQSSGAAPPRVGQPRRRNRDATECPAVARNRRGARAYLRQAEAMTEGAGEYSLEACDPHDRQYRSKINPDVLKITSNVTQTPVFLVRGLQNATNSLGV
jgi:hypothetical protein